MMNASNQSDAPTSRKQPYWRLKGHRPGTASQKWYDKDRWEMEKARCGLSGRPQPPWQEAVPVADILADITKKLGVSRSIALESMQVGWPDIVGAEVAKHCRPVDLTDGTLVLSVNSAVWMFTLRRISQTTLLSSVQAAPHGSEVKRIALRPSSGEGGTRP